MTLIARTRNLLKALPPALQFSPWELLGALGLSLASGAWNAWPVLRPPPDGLAMTLTYSLPATLEAAVLTTLGDAFGLWRQFLIWLD
jgi:hypothetical protein